MVSKNKTYYNAILQHTNKSFAYCIVDIRGDKKTIKVGSKFLKRALDGDEVSIKVKGDKYGFVNKIITRKNHNIIGKVHLCGDYAFIKPQTPNYYRDIYISSDQVSKFGLGEQDIVNISIKDWSKKEKNPTGKIISKLNLTKDEILLHSLGVPYKFDSKITDEIKNYDIQFGNICPENRVDLRYLDIFSIDPDNCMDIDDALSIEKLDNGYSVGVHIADVSHWVRSGSYVDTEAYKRCFTTYLPQISAPMLPNKLSSDICSLIQDKDRYVISIIYTIDDDWDIVDKNIQRSIIRNKKTFTYQEAEDNRNDVGSVYYHRLNMLYSIGIKQRKLNFPNELIFDKKDSDWVLDENHNPLYIKNKIRIPTMDLIQSWMLLANKHVTEFIEYKKETSNVNIPWIYRTHKSLSVEDIKNLRKDFQQIGQEWDFDISNHENINHALMYNNDPELVSELVSTKLRPAKYTDYKSNHFAIGTNQYTHFTSPIRRYSDLIIHRILCNIIDSKPIHKASFKDQCDHITTQERKVSRIENMYKNSLSISYLQKHNSDIDVKIMEFSKKGIYIKTNYGMYSWILVKNSDKQDIWKWNQENRKWNIVGKDLNLGDNINISYIIDNETKEIKFKL